MSFSSIMTYLGISPVSLGWLSALILGAVIALAVSQLLEGIQGTARSVIIASPPVVPVTYATQGCQTDSNTKNTSSPPVVDCKETAKGVIPIAASHGLEEIFKIYCKQGSAALSDEDLISLVDANRIQARNLEKEIGDYKRAVLIRRKIMQRSIKLSDGLSYDNFDYSKVFGACCENVIGYVGLPVGIAGPLLVDGKQYFVPMATTEGCLVASTNRGCRAVSMSSSGITTRIIFDGMSRAPVVRFPSLVKCCEARDWMRENFSKLEATFNSSSRFARLQSIDTRVVGKLLYIRFVASTGDAMGMNMVSKGTDLTLKLIQKHFRDMEILALSGNYCTDKKAAAVNWIEGRGKSVIAEAIIPAQVVKDVLKSSVPAIRDLNVAKNLVGSAMAGSIGGFNAHASNIVSAVFIATGQDPAQNVTSSNCMTYLDVAENGEDLYISCTMPSIEVGTVGGGTVLPSQAACLEILGVNGPDLLNPGNNSRTLASVVCATVLAGELSLMSALAAGDLVKSHLKYNRSSSNIAASLGAAKPVKPQVPSVSLHASSKPHSRLPEVEAQVTVNVIDLPTECKQS